MDTRPRTRARRSYTEFEPSSELVEERGSETLLIELTGFSKDQVKVQLEPTGNLKVSGERPLGDNKWSRFEKHFQVSSNCNTDEIRATFEDGVLFIIMPKFIKSSGLNEPTHDRPISQEAAINDNRKHSASETEVNKRPQRRVSFNQEERSMPELESPQLPLRQKEAAFSTLETPLGQFGYSKQTKFGDEKMKHGGSKLKTITRRAGNLIQDCKHTSLGSVVVVAILVAVGISINYARS